MSDDTEPPPGQTPPRAGQLINFPTGDDVTGRPPALPDPSRLFPEPRTEEISPDPPEESDREFPAIPQPPDPEFALRSEGIDSADSEVEEEVEYFDEESDQRRSLADRLGDWLEFRLERARSRHADEAAFREAEIARKAELLKGRTAAEVAMMEQNGKLRQAMLRARADKASARGKADAASMKSGGAGLGDRGRRNNSGSGGGSRPGGSRNPSSPAKPQQPKPPGRQLNSPPRKAPDSKRGPEQRKDSGPRRGPDPKRGPDSRKGPDAKKGPAEKRTRTDPKTPPRPRTDSSARKTPDPKKAPDSKKAPDPKRAPAPRKTSDPKGPGSQDSSGAGSKSGWGKWKKAPKDAPVNGRSKDPKRPGKDSAGKDPAGKPDPGKSQRDNSTGKGGRWKRRPSPGKGPDGSSKPHTGPEGRKGPEGSGKARSGASKGSRGGWWKPGRNRTAPGADRSGAGSPNGGPHDPYEDLFAPQSPEYTAEWPGRDRGAAGPATGHRSDGGFGPGASDDVVDAVIVDDPADPFGADRIRQPGLTTGAPGLPPAPEPHTQRPGTARAAEPDQEDPLGSQVTKPAAAGHAMAAQHRTNITFGEFLTDIVNIALQAAVDKERAQELDAALGRLADALRDMATDLVGDHNISSEVVDAVTDLADGAARMKALAQRCATECETASEAARLAAISVGRVYGEDMKAKDDAGLADASAAAHHD